MEEDLKRHWISVFQNQHDCGIFTRESSYCFQRVLVSAILSVCHTGGSGKNGPS